MWSAKFMIKNTDSIYTLLTTEHHVTDQFHPVNFERNGKHVDILGIHYLLGEQSEKDAYAKALQKHRKTLKFERHGDTIVVLMREEERFYELMYDPQLYNPTPAVIKDGYETWTVLAFDRSTLERLIKALTSEKRKFPEFRLHSITQTDLREICFPRFLPDLPEQQERAFQLAVENGYYAIPRKSNLAQLAKFMKVSTSTFQEHLRKAEGRLIPFFGTPYFTPQQTAKSEKS